MTFLDSFIPQLLATLIGGAIGVFGVWLAFRWQRKAAARDGVELAVENLLLRIAEHLTLADAYMKEYKATMWGGRNEVAAYLPARGGSFHRR